ncbi:MULTISPECIES: host specificity factor TipJ family phage tail protein [unclassified Bradyrhizobium]|uniref:host specificity factor TipJ family phage tail protein n=1 Tax=unclassified Bradyrhizobium TaxID=2631580 RepID=UPI001FFAF771|nr:MULTISPECIES: host specificity factor TipJ family phage tail protein [unclassified Bradyrhizobium]MCK1536892.1 phage tail protein [Bradyrhizobium sp. 176]MCK1560195.1 phage tail protein [Bradyrhizobium sp. 171]
MSRALILPHLDVAKARKTLTLPPGLSIGEMVAVVFPELPEHRDVRVVIGGDVIDPALWRRVRPHHGTTVVIRLVPSGNDTLRSVLSVAVMVAALAVGQFYAPGIAGALLPAGSLTGLGASAIAPELISLVSAVTVAGLSLGGTLLLNAFIPPTSLGDQGTTTNLNSITGVQNASNPGGVIPSILGRHRYAPVYAAPPYTEVIGDDQYVIAAFEFGFGPLNFYNHQLGDTPIGSFSDVEMEVQQGLPGDPPLTLYPQQVLEEQIAINLRNDEAPSSRVTARDVTEVSVDITFMQGLVYIDSKGRNTPAGVQIRRRQRKVGDVAWTTLSDMQFVGSTRQPFRRSMRWTLPERGQYEIELHRSNEDYDDNTQVMARSDWTAIRAFRPESPFNFDRPTAKVALRIRASNQLNGIVNNYNAVAALLCPDWDVPTQSWITRESSNPAALALYVLKGPANVRPKVDDEIDLTGLADFHEFCVAKGLTYNRVHDYSATRIDVLKDICAAGRASPRDDGITWGVVIDRPQYLTYVSAITPRNSWDFQGSTPYPLFPDAYRIKFIDATNGWNQAERIVPFPGVSADAVEVTEDLDQPGVTDPVQIWKAARRRQYELIYRPHSYTVSQDVESLVLGRGDLAPLNQDVLDRDQVAARIRRVGGGSIILDDSVTMVSGRSYAASIRLSNGSSIRRSVLTVPGEISSLQVIGDLSGIEEDNLVLFGTTVKGPTLDVLVKNVERGDNLTATLTMVDAAPIIDDLTDAEIPPAWDGRVGDVTDVSALVPGTPQIAGINTDVAGFINVTIWPGAGVAVPASYVVSHRIHGGGGFTTLTIDAATGVAQISGYLTTDDVDIKAHAVSLYGVVSGDSAVSIRNGIVEFSSGTTSLAPGTWYLGASNAFASEASAQVTMPACTVDRLDVAATLAPGGSETFVYTLRKNNADTAVTCTVTGVSIIASDSAHTATFGAGDTADIKVVASGSAASTTHLATITTT